MGALLELSNIDKSFHENRVLKSVNISFMAGEVHAIVGENGAGKSTLMKIIGGIYRRDTGELKLEGTPVNVDSPIDAMNHGISLVHQELSLADNRTVAQNIFCNREPTNRLGFIKWSELYRMAQDLFDDMAVDIHPKSLAGSLNVARQQLVEIAKALSLNARIIIMDEPTSSLSEQEVDSLYGIVERLRDRGVTVVFISHKLTEVFRVADRITVLRDGELIGTLPTADTSSSEIIRMMVGRNIEDLYPPKTKEVGDALMDVKDLGFRNQFSDISFTVKRGEILGLAGLVGAQRSESMLALFGAAPKTSGTVEVHGKPITIKSPRDAIAAGICYLTEDRRSKGLFQTMTVSWNIVVTSLKKILATGSFYQGRKRQDAVSRLMESLDINPRRPENWVQNLSGGNQQKVLLGKWLFAEPEILIVDEPTRGVDVGAKSQIHLALRELVTTGIGVVVISSEQPEIVGLCDRVLVFKEGRITAELSGDEVTQEEIVKYATV
ncbi:MAG: sugar ABC transporter ATP-binding protein [Alkalispirochaeta sp.]